MSHVYIDEGHFTLGAAGKKDKKVRRMRGKLDPARCPIWVSDYHLPFEFKETEVIPWSLKYTETCASTDLSCCD